MIELEKIKLEKIAGLGEWTKEERSEEKRTEKALKEQIFRVPDGKAFLVVRPKTLEVRCERNLSQKLREEYETVMESRYFGRGGIEIVPTGQLEMAEIEDLIRLSYNMTKELTE